MKRLKLGLVSGLTAGQHGGPAAVLRLHAAGLRARHDVEIYGVTPSGTDLCAIDNVHAHSYPITFPKRWFRGRGLRRSLIDAAPDLDLIHAHMLWDHPVWAAAQAARQHHKPLVISPHGSVMTPQRSGGLHKRVYRKLVLDRILHRTAAIHVLNLAEADACRRFGIGLRLFVIPNGLPPASFELNGSADAAYDRWPQLRGARIIVFLGRLCRIKGVDLLLSAFARIRFAGFRDFLLVIAGPDEHEHRRELERAARQLDIVSHVLFTGPVYGPQKDALIRSAELFVLPSRSEAFSVSLLEAAARAKPAVYTTACNLPELARSGGGIEVRAEEKEITRALETAVRYSSTTLQEMGRRAREFVMQRFTVESVTGQLEDMYSELVM